MDLLKILGNPETKVERLLHILSFPVIIILGFLMLILFICYWILGICILDGIYYIFTGDTIIFKHLPKG